LNCPSGARLDAPEQMPFEAVPEGTAADANAALSVELVDEQP
jgi:hypothetical protein